MSCAVDADLKATSRRNVSDLTRIRRVAPQDARNIQDIDDTNIRSETGNRISGWTDGYKKQKVQGRNAREDAKEHNSARRPSWWWS